MSGKVKYYGHVKMSACYHVDPECWDLRRSLKRKPFRQRVEYESEPKALAAGHARLCRLCRIDNGMVIEGCGQKYTPTKLQLEALQAIADMYKESGGMNMSDVARRLGWKIPRAYRVIKLLRGWKMVKRTVKIGGLISSRKTVCPTPLGLELLRSHQPKPEATPQADAQA